MIDRERVKSVAYLITRYSLYGIVFLVPVYFAWFQENFSVFDLNKSVILHLLLGIGLLAWLVGVSVSGQIHWHGNKILLIVGKAVALLFLLSTIFSLHPLISLWGSYERMQGLYNLWHYLGLSFLLIAALRNKKDVQHVIVMLLIGSAFACLYGLIQALGLDFLRWGESATRIFSTFGQPNFFGHYVAVLLPLTIYAAMYVSKNVYVRLSYGILGVAQFICLIFTYSRGAWLAVLITGVLFSLFLLLRAQRKFLAVSLLVFIAASGFTLRSTMVRTAILEHVPFDNKLVVERFLSIFELGYSTTPTRIAYWQAGLEIFTSAPWQRKLIGYGPDTEATLYAHEYRPEWAYYEQINSFPDRAHNFILDILLQFGLVGELLLALLVGVIVNKLWRFLRQEQRGPDYWRGVALLSSLLIYALNNLFSFSLVGMNVVLYTLLALAWLTGNGFQVWTIPIKFFRPLSRWLILGSLAALFLVLLYNYNLKFYLADYYYFKVKKAEAKGDCPATLSYMDKVIELYPLNHFYNRQYIHHSTNCFSAITSDASYQQLGRALVSHVNNIPPRERQFYTLIEMSHMYSIMGFYVDRRYYQEAEPIYKEMLKINPYITTTYQDYGRMKLWQRRDEEAIAIFKQGIEVLPPYDSVADINRRQDIIKQKAYFQVLIGMAYFDKLDTKSAISWYKEALALDPLQTAAYKNLSDTYYQLGDIDTAISYTEKALRIDPYNNMWSFSLATLYKEKGDMTRARLYAEQAVEVNAQDEKAKQLLEDLKAK